MSSSVAPALLRGSVRRLRCRPRAFPPASPESNFAPATPAAIAASLAALLLGLTTAASTAPSSPWPPPPSGDGENADGEDERTAEGRVWWQEAAGGDAEMHARALEEACGTKLTELYDCMDAQRKGLRKVSDLDEAFVRCADPFYLRFLSCQKEYERRTAGDRFYVEPFHEDSVGFIGERQIEERLEEFERSPETMTAEDEEDFVFLVDLLAILEEQDVTVDMFREREGLPPLPEHAASEDEGAGGGLLSRLLYAVHRKVLRWTTKGILEEWKRGREEREAEEEERRRESAAGNPWGRFGM